MGHFDKQEYCSKPHRWIGPCSWFFIFFFFIYFLRTSFFLFFIFHKFIPRWDIKAKKRFININAISANEHTRFRPMDGNWSRLKRSSRLFLDREIPSTTRGNWRLLIWKSARPRGEERVVVLKVFCNLFFAGMWTD